MTEQIVGDDTLVSAFQTTSTGKIHLLEEGRPWGYGLGCGDRFVLGTRLETQAKNIDCAKCRTRLEAGDV
jgi:hypothetical protein